MPDSAVTVVTSPFSTSWNIFSFNACSSYILTNQINSYIHSYRYKQVDLTLDRYYHSTARSMCNHDILPFKQKENVYNINKSGDKIKHKILTKESRVYAKAKVTTVAAESGTG